MEGVASLKMRTVWVRIPLRAPSYMNDEHEKFEQVKAKLKVLANTFDYETTETSSSFEVTPPKWIGHPKIKLEMD